MVNISKGHPSAKVFGLPHKGTPEHFTQQHQIQQQATQNVKDTQSSGVNGNGGHAIVKMPWNK